MSTDTLNHAPPLELTDHREMVDLAGGDPVAELVGGRRGYLAELTVDDCLLPSGRGPREPAVFDRCYYQVGAEPRVLVDVLPGGSQAEIGEQEAQRRVSEKTAWCEANNVQYIVFVNPTLTPYS
jgi:hypothetical protein